ncbi:alpha/beta hydrolase [Breznakiella homolactica]|uniref:Alpha/beta hydrolase n=1 Tax=Breznakiella homolactica TaxID=2798577 RepID=A0A7T7XMR4_9SPIR|nr:alpha/beta hydrolase [Breznakiella homolactica]QQO09132.1 alpha/beta hydrolase [Breznakiella homolactica]
MALKILVITILSLIGLILIGLLIVLINSPGRLAPLKDSRNKVIPGSISEKVWVDINGIRQGMFIRGENPQNPVILYLHGGPGTPLLPFISYLEKSERLEKYFTMCYWDQRGSGMTYSRSTDPSTMTTAQMVEDTRAVTEYLKSRFGQDRIYLMGHSWGSYLGVKTIEKYPENYLAYIGIGQLSDQRESERLAYKYMLNHAAEIGDKKVIEKLEPFDPDADTFPQNEYLINVRTAIINKYGVGMMHEGVTFPTILKALISFKGYTLPEKTAWFLGADFSMAYLFDRVVMKDSLFESSASFEVPFYITQGFYDYQVSYTLAKNYLETLDAPKKGFFTFENSAHSPNMEEPELFVKTVRQIAEENPGITE